MVEDSFTFEIKFSAWQCTNIPFRVQYGSPLIGSMPHPIVTIDAPMQNGEKATRGTSNDVNFGLRFSTLSELRD